jgi:hypothetical protein
MNHINELELTTANFISIYIINIYASHAWHSLVERQTRNIELYLMSSLVSSV